MTRIEKNQAYCEIEILRLDIAVAAARDRYQQSLSAFDLAAYHELEIFKN